MNGLQEKLRSMYAHDATVLAGIENGSVRGIPLTQGKIALVDHLDYKMLSSHKWCAVPSGNAFYATRGTPRIDGYREHIKMHREVLGLTIGDGRIADHINRDTLDNRRVNLREANKVINGWNRALLKNNTSGYYGVSWWKPGRKWSVRITIRRRRIQIGYFYNILEAAVAYDQAAIKYRGCYAILNFPN